MNVDVEFNKYGYKKIDDTFYWNDYRVVEVYRKTLGKDHHIDVMFYVHNDYEIVVHYPKKTKYSHTILHKTLSTPIELFDIIKYKLK